MDAIPSRLDPLPVHEGDSRTDEELARAAGRGDPQAFEALYHRHKGLVYSWARRHAGAELAADVTQEAFAYLARRLPGLEFRGRLAAFLHPVVVHIAASARRREAKHAGERQGLAELARTEAGAEPGAGEDLAAALGDLSEGQREVVELRFEDGLALEEIAAALAIPLGTVKSRLHHALLALRAHPRTRRYFEARPES